MNGLLFVALALHAPPALDPAAVAPATVAWARAAVDVAAPPALRLDQLHRALARRGVEPRDGWTPTAEEAFRERRADCVGWSLLFAALAREVGVPVRFVVFDRWGAAGRRRGNLRVSEGHLAVAWAADPTLAYDAAGRLDRRHGAPRPITDATARAIFFSNRGLQRLLAGDTPAARRWLRVAVAADPAWPPGWHHLAVVERLGTR